MKFGIREATPQDLEKIAQLQLDVADSSVTAEEFRRSWLWLFRDNLRSSRKVLVGVDEQDSVVAHYGMFALEFAAAGRPLVGGFLCQLMVAEVYRTELTFPRMELRMLREYGQLGVDFVYGLVNKKKVMDAHLAFGFQHLGDLPVYVRPFKLRRLRDSYVKNTIVKAIVNLARPVVELGLAIQWHRVSKEVEITSADRFDSSVDVFLHSVEERFQTGAVRNSRILNWRFRNSPRPYQILIAMIRDAVVGYIVLRRMSMKEFDVLAIVDILFPPDRGYVGKALLEKVSRMAVRSNVDMAACLLNSHDPLLPVFRRMGYLRSPESFSLIVHGWDNASVPLEGNLFQKWHVTWFDHDLV